jgi:hypothetical protein
VRGAETGAASKSWSGRQQTVQVASQAASKAWGGLSAEMTVGGTRLVSVFSAVAARLGLVTSALLLGYDVVTKVIPPQSTCTRWKSTRWNRSGRSWRKLTACSSRVPDHGGTGSVTACHGRRAGQRDHRPAEDLPQNLDRAHQIQIDRANLRAQDVTRAGVSDQDPEYQKYLAEAVTYKKALKALDDYQANG